MITIEVNNKPLQARKNETILSALKRAGIEVPTLCHMADLMRHASLCGLGQSAPNPLLSTLRWFREEYLAHVRERRCPAGVCAELLQYRIDPAKCKGCTLCSKKCPSEAIMGAPKSPHYIVPDKCVGCGVCSEVCRFNAVIVE